MTSKFPVLKGVTRTNECISYSLIFICCVTRSLRYVTSVTVLLCGRSNGYYGVSNSLIISQIPYNLVDLLERSQPSLFYDGCVVAEIRDSRRSVSGFYKTSYVLLRPSHRCLLADINQLTSDEFRWSQEDRFSLESQLLLATSEPLCLDPSPAVNIARNKQYCKRRAAQSNLLLRLAADSSVALTARNLPIFLYRDTLDPTYSL